LRRGVTSFPFSLLTAHIDGNYLADGGRASKRKTGAMQPACGILGWMRARFSNFFP
jgi:hypothetical protein